MNLWSCANPACNRTVVGLGGAIGLRAIGWQVSFGGSHPQIYCPEHRLDPMSCINTNRMPCTICTAEKTASAIQETIYTEADRKKIQCGRSPSRSSGAPGD